MKKANQASPDPFAQYFKAYEELANSLELSNSAEDIADLTNKMNNILHLHYKAIMSFYDKQYRQILEHVAQNNMRIENLTQKSTVKTQEFLENSLKQSEQLMQENMAHFKKMFKLEPQALLEEILAKTNENLSTQVTHWNDLYAQQSKEMQKEMQSIHEKAQNLLESSEQLRKDSLTKYKELEKTMHEFIARKQKNVNKVPRKRR